MKVLTRDLKDRIGDYLDSIRSDYDEEEIKNCTDILLEKENQRLSDLDNTLLLRIIDDDKLVNEIEEITDKKETKNAFD